MKEAISINPLATRIALRLAFTNRNRRKTDTRKAPTFAAQLRRIAQD